MQFVIGRAIAYIYAYNYSSQGTVYKWKGSDCLYACGLHPGSSDDALPQQSLVNADW